MMGPQKKTLSKIKPQQGWTFWSMLFMMSVILLFAYVGMQLVPVYAGNESVKNAMELALDGGDLRRINKAAIIRKVRGQLYLDGRHKMIDYKKDLQVKRGKGKLMLEVNYQTEVPLFFNLHLLAKFENAVEKSLDAK